MAVIGGGIGGPALALALQQRGIPVCVYEKDTAFNQRHQGYVRLSGWQCVRVSRCGRVVGCVLRLTREPCCSYGLTMQQGARALQALGFSDYPSLGIQSQRHTVYTPDGVPKGNWGRETHSRKPHRNRPSRQNVHIPRQRLRQLLMEQLAPGTVKWGYELSSFEQVSSCRDASTEEGSPPHHLRLMFAGGRSAEASVLVGADGIFSAVRRQKIGDTASPLQCVKQVGHSCGVRVVVFLLTCWARGVPMMGGGCRTFSPGSSSVWSCLASCPPLTPSPISVCSKLQTAPHECAFVNEVAWL